jgi:pyruvate formate lyase activating enzyme
MKGLIFNIKRYAIHDGPGIRVTFFLKACPLACWWCHNPEGIDGEIQEIERVHRIGEKKFTRKEKVGQYYKPEELLEIARKDLVFMEESGGGVTFSGGEPLVQHSFLSETLRLFRDEGIHTAVDTSGYASRQVADEIIPLADLFLFDIKHLDPLRHKEFTGVSNELILDNYKYILERAKKVIIRIPLIPGFNDDALHLAALRDFVRGGQQGGNIQRIDLLPYHRIGSSKYKTFGQEYRMKDIKQPTAERMDELKDFFEDTGIRVKLGG